MRNPKSLICPLRQAGGEGSPHLPCAHLACAWYDTVSDSCAPIALLAKLDKLERALWDLRSENEYRYTLNTRRLDHSGQTVHQPLEDQQL